MKYIKGEDRRQYVLFPACLDEYIEQDNPVRYNDAFVDSQNLEELGFNHTTTIPSACRKNEQHFSKGNMRIISRLECEPGIRLPPQTVRKP